MKVSNRSTVSIACIATGVASQTAHAGFTDTEPDRQDRWHSLEPAIFDERKPIWDAKAVVVDAPGCAFDAALVPITVKLAHPKNVEGLYLVIGDNPSPVLDTDISLASNPMPTFGLRPHADKGGR